MAPNIQHRITGNAQPQQQVVNQQASEKKLPWWKRIKENVSETISIYRQMRTDNIYHEEFVSGMNAVALDPFSEFARMGLKYSEENETISYIAVLQEEFATINSDYMVLDKLNEETYFVTQYLREKLGLHMYVSLPDYYHIEDPTSDKVSLAYLAVWHFQPMIDKDTKDRYMRTMYLAGSSVGATLAGIVSMLLFL